MFQRYQFAYSYSVGNFLGNFFNVHILLIMRLHVFLFQMMIKLRSSQIALIRTVFSLKKGRPFTVGNS